jgi:hypothetical protein
MILAGLRGAHTYSQPRKRRYRLVASAGAKHSPCPPPAAGWEPHLEGPRLVGRHVSVHARLERVVLAAWHDGPHKLVCGQRGATPAAASRPRGQIEQEAQAEQDHPSVPARRGLALDWRWTGFGLALDWRWTGVGLARACSVAGEWQQAQRAGAAQACWAARTSEELALQRPHAAIRAPPELHAAAVHAALHPVAAVDSGRYACRRWLGGRAGGRAGRRAGSLCWVASVGGCW